LTTAKPAKRGAKRINSNIINWNSPTRVTLLISLSLIAAFAIPVQARADAVKSVTVGSISASPHEGNASTPTYSVTTANIANGQSTSVSWFASDGTTSASAPTGVSITGTDVSSDASTLTVSAGNTSLAGSYYFTVTIDGTTSSLQTLVIQNYAVGDTGPGGGIVFYVSPSPFPCGPDSLSNCNYLEVAPKDWSNPTIATSDPSLVWVSSPSQSTDVPGIANDGSVLNSASGIGLGLHNTNQIGSLNNFSNPDAPGTVHNYIEGVDHNYYNWYIPTSAELNLLYEWRSHAPAAFDFDSVTYWSSSEATSTTGWGQDFSTGNQAATLKSASRLVRPIRAFGERNDATLSTVNNSVLIKGVVPSSFGTPFDAPGGVTPGEVRLTPAQAADTAT